MRIDTSRYDETNKRILKNFVANAIKRINLMSSMTQSKSGSSSDLQVYIPNGGGVMLYIVETTSV
jgi:hypothetical protein